MVHGERLTVTKQEGGIPSGLKTKQNLHLEPSTVNVRCESNKAAKGLSASVTCNQISLGHNGAQF